jgi:tetratricopeptide (TPR) repeat protein
MRSAISNAFVVLGLVGWSCAPAEDRYSDLMVEELPDGVEAISLLGDTLRAPALGADIEQQRQGELAEARDAWESDPQNVDSIIWIGRRTAYLGQYRDAIDIYTEGIRLHPNDPRLYRHRGHRYITTRQLDLAIADFERAAALTAGQPDQVEPDGQPNARDIPTSTLQSNIWYHLGLAYYLVDDLENALRAYQECMEVSENNDMLVATSYWYYMALRRAGRHDEAAALLAPITPEMDIIENGTYQQLLLMFKAVVDAEGVLDTSNEADVALANATAGYGVGFWHDIEGRTEEAVATWERVLAGPQWAAFGYIASEAEGARRR